MKYLVAREGIIDRSKECFAFGSLAINHGKEVHISIGFDLTSPPIGRGVLEYDDGSLYIIVEDDSGVTNMIDATPCLSYRYGKGEYIALDVSLCGANADIGIPTIGVQNKQKAN